VPNVDVQFIRQRSTFIFTTAKSITTIINNSTSPKLRGILNDLQTQFRRKLGGFYENKDQDVDSQPSSMLECLLWGSLLRNANRNDTGRRLSPLYAPTDRDTTTSQRDLAARFAREDLDYVLDDGELHDACSCTNICDEDDDDTSILDITSLASSEPCGDLLDTPMSDQQSMASSTIISSPNLSPEDECQKQIFPEISAESEAQNELLDSDLTVARKCWMEPDSKCSQTIPSMSPYLVVEEFSSSPLLGDESF
jgi:hypothetical protein